MSISDEEITELEQATANIPDSLFRALIARLRAAEAVLAKLPLTADGVPVTIDSVVWYVSGSIVQRIHVAGYECHSHRINGNYWTVFFEPSGFSSIWDWSRAYSTEAAARAAQGEVQS